MHSADPESWIPADGLFWPWLLLVEKVSAARCKSWKVRFPERGLRFPGVNFHCARISFIRLAPTKKLRYAVSVICGVFPPHPLPVVPVAVQNPAKEGYRMACKNTWAGLVLAVGLSSSLTACTDTKTLQENEQLKAKVAELQKENGQLGNNLETLTIARDALTKENEALKAESKARKTKRSGAKAASRKRRRRSKST
jgi:FtsZ-binding cell division protein ZapB